MSCPAFNELKVGVRSPDPMIPRTELDKVCRTHLRAEGPKSVGCVMNEGCETPSTVERGFENRCESAELPEKCREPIVCVCLLVGRAHSCRVRACASLVARAPGTYVCSNFPVLSTAPEPRRDGKYALVLP